MFIHSVYFWLRPNLTDNERAQFVAGLQSLIDISSVRSGEFGTPAAANRPVIESSYSYGLLLRFDDVAAHDAYQVDLVHDRFRTECSPLWTQVRIFDFHT